MNARTPGPWRLHPNVDWAIQGANGVTVVHEAGLNPADTHFIVKACNMHDDLVAVLNTIVGQEPPNRWGYDAAGVALDNTWRARARELLQKAAT